MPAGAIPFPFGDCRICNDKATGVHYGVATCEGCKGFFKRSTTKSEKYKCFFGGQCVLSPKNRNRCKACRYQKCLQLGMSMEAVKMGRIPKVDKERALAAHKHVQDHQHSHHSNSPVGESPETINPTDTRRKSSPNVNIQEENLPYENPQMPATRTCTYHQPSAQEAQQWMSNPTHSPPTAAIPFQAQSHVSYSPPSQLPPPPLPPMKNLHSPPSQQSHLLMCPSRPHLPPDQFPQAPYSSHSPELATSAGFSQSHPKAGDFNQAQHINRTSCASYQEACAPGNNIIVKQEIQETGTTQDCCESPPAALRRHASMPEPPLRTDCMSPQQSESRPNSRSHFSTDVIRELLCQVMGNRQPTQNAFPDTQTSNSSNLVHQVMSFLSPSNQSQQKQLPQISAQPHSIHDRPLQGLDLSWSGAPVGNVFLKNSGSPNSTSHHNLGSNSRLGIKRRASDGARRDDGQPVCKKPLLCGIHGEEPMKELHKLVVDLLLHSQPKDSNDNSMAKELLHKLDVIASKPLNRQRASSSSECPEPPQVTHTNGKSPRCWSEPLVLDDVLTTSPDATIHVADTGMSSRPAPSAHADSSCTPGIAPATTCESSQESSDNLNMLISTLQKLKQSDEKHNVIVRKYVTMMEEELSGQQEPHELNKITQATPNQAQTMWTSLFQNIPSTNKRILGLSRDMPGFNSLNQEDRSALMEQAYFDLWMLSSSPLFKNGDSFMRLPCGACYSRWWMDHFLPDELVKAMFRFADEIDALKLNSLELLILCAIRLTDPDRTGLSNTEEVRVLNNHYWDVLAHEMQNNHGASSGRMLINIFRVLPSLLPITKLQLQITGNFRPDKFPDKAWKFIKKEAEEAESTLSPCSTSAPPAVAVTNQD